MRTPVAIALLVASGLASLGAKEKPGDSRRGFRFRGPEVVKVDWNARSLVAADLNGDGRADLGLVNRERSRIELLYRRQPGEKLRRVRPARPDRWEPVLDDAPYLRENVTFDGGVHALAAGDLDGDGRADLAYGGKEDGIFVRFREKDDAWSDPVELDSGELRPWSKTLRIRDLDDDGRAELAVLTAGGLETWRFDGREPKGEPTLHRLSDEHTYGLYFADLDVDGRVDWAYVEPGSERALRTRFGTPDGFGPETTHAFSPRRLVSVAEKGLDGKSPPSFVAVESETEEVNVFTFAPVGKPANGEPGFPLTRNVFGPDADDTAFATADFDGDGLLDLVAADSASAEILFFRGRRQGGFARPSAFPSLRGVASLATGRFRPDAPPSLLVVSAGESIAGLSRFEDGKRFGFPKPLPVGEGDPVVARCADLDGDGSDEVLVVTKQRYDYSLILLDSAEKDGLSKSGTIPLKGLKRDPNGLFPGDFDGDDHLDLLVLVSRSPAIVLRGDGEGGFKEVAAKSPVRRSLFADLDSSRLGLGDLDQDGRPELLVAGKGFVRTVGLRGDDLVILDQCNTRRGKEEARCPLVYSVEKDAPPELLCHLPEEDALQILRRDGDGVFRHHSTTEVGSFVARSLALLPTGPGGSEEILAIGEHSFRRIPLVASPRGLRILSRHETDLRDASHDVAFFGDFDTDGQADLLCLDSSDHLLEFLRFDPGENSWLSVLHFEVFEENLHYRGRKGGQSEPREAVVVDLNGDGKDDFALLVHDRVLCYYQE